MAKRVLGAGEVYVAVASLSPVRILPPEAKGPRMSQKSEWLLLTAEDGPSSEGPLFDCLDLFRLKTSFLSDRV